MEHEDGGDASCSWYTWNDHQEFEEETRGILNQMKNRDHPDYNVIEIGQNSLKIPEHLRRFAVTQVPVKSRQLTLVRKTYNNNNDDEDDEVDGDDDAN